jgi:hypothetical protein
VHHYLIGEVTAKFITGKLLEKRSLKEDFKPGEIFRFVKRINEKRKKVWNIKEVFLLTDGTMAGIVELEDHRRVPFKGEILIEKFSEKRVMSTYFAYPLDNGALISGVRLEDNVDVPFVIRMDNTVEILNVKIDVTDYFLPEGGRRAILFPLYLSDFQRVGFESLPFYSSDTKIGMVFLKEGVSFKEDVMKKIKRIEIKGNWFLMGYGAFLLPSGMLAGIVELEDGRKVPFRGDALIERIGEKRVIDVNPLDFHYLSDGTLVGLVKLEGREEWSLFKGDAIMEEIGGEKITGASALHVLPGDILAGIVKLKDDGYLPFKGDIIIEEAQGKRLIDAKFFNSLPDGSLACAVKLEDSRYVLLKGNLLIEEIQGKKIIDVRELLSMPDGTLAGVVRLGDGRSVPFRGNDLLEEVQGKEIISAFFLRCLPDGTLTGAFRLKGDIPRSFKGIFFWYEAEIFLI